MCVSDILEDQKKVSDPLVLELQMIVNYYVSAGNLTQVL